MNIPNPFSSGNFSLTGESRRTKSTRTTRKDHKRRQKTPNTQLVPAPCPKTAPVNFRIRAVSFIAWVHLILGTIYASSLVYRFISYLIGDTVDPLFLLGMVVFIVPVYLILEAIIGAWCETVNDIFIGAVDCWPEFLTLERFFNQLATECEADIARILCGSALIPESTAPRSPHIDPSAQSVLYLATYLGCFFHAPLSALIKTVFWRTELTFGILFLAYLFTSSPSQSQR